MNERILARFIKDLVESRTTFPFEHTARLAEYQNQRFRIRVEREFSLPDRRELFEANSSTISSLPSGAPCDCCGGSGKAR